jgi:hypothetical protein
LKRTLFLILFALLPFLPLVSQNRFGIKAGAAAVLTPVFDISRGSVGIEPGHKWGFGFHAGVSFCISNDVIYFKPELLFESSTFEYIVQNNYETKMVRQSINRLNIPLLIGAQLGMASIYFGPSVAIKTGLPKALADVEDFEKLYDRISLEYHIGFGFDLSEKLKLDLRYIGYFGKNYEGLEKLGYQTFTLNKSNASLMISICYTL